MADSRLKYYVWAKSTTEGSVPCLVGACLHEEDAVALADRTFDRFSNQAWVAVLDGPAGDAVYCVNDRSNNKR